jgi:(2Fe-2S) ferredoxin
MKTLPNKLEVHTLVCTNEKPGDKPCCSKVGGMEFFTKLKEKLKESGIYLTHKATRTGCLGYCNNVGCTITIHRNNEPPQWFTEVKAENFDEIWKEITKQL